MGAAAPVAPGPFFKELIIEQKQTETKTGSYYVRC